MLILLFIIIGFLFCFFTILVFSLMGAGRRADKAEESILAIIQPDSLDDAVRALEDALKLQEIALEHTSTTLKA
jgi:ABC-type uncharacterized transport system substrate-binding protein